MDGLDELLHSINNLTKKVEKAASKDSISISFDKLFSTSFMKKYTTYSSIDLFLKDIGVENQQEFEELPETILDKHVVQNSKFNSWEAMHEKALKEYASKFFSL